jgi:hypothetical protein
MNLKIIWGIMVQLSCVIVAAQTFNGSCFIQKRAHSFEKGSIHLFEINNIVLDSVVFSKDTVINNKVYYWWGLTRHSLYCYWAEDGDGALWLYEPYFNTGEVLFMPSSPFVGYQVHYNHFEATIIGIGEKRTFGNVSYDDLIIFEVKYISSTYKSTSIEYFKPGVGWVAYESLPLSTTYLKCVKYR